MVTSGCNSGDGSTSRQYCVVKACDLDGSIFLSVHLTTATAQMRQCGK